MSTATWGAGTGAPSAARPVPAVARRRAQRAALDSCVGTVTVAKAYRLLKAVLNTAVNDGLICRNPCRIKGAGKECSPERPALSFEQVYALADAIGPRYRALVLLATFAGLHWGELVALRRRDLDLEARTVRVEEAITELKDGSRVTGRPKSDAGVRTVALPQVILPDLRWHLQRFAESGPDGLVFVGAKGAPLRRANFSKHWQKARTAARVPEAHFHHLRHAGNTMAAATGVSLRELMSRMGHTSTRAALIYQHATSDRDRAIAEALSTLAEGTRQHRANERKDDDDVNRARNGHAARRALFRKQGPRAETSP